MLGGAAEGESLTRVKILTIECDFRILALALSWNLGFFRRPGNRLEFTIFGLSLSKHRIGLASLGSARLKLLTSDVMKVRRLGRFEAVKIYRRLQ